MTTYSEERSVHKQGDSLMVSLPKKWAEANGIKKGEKVTVKYDSVYTVIPKTPPIEFTSSFNVKIKDSVVVFEYKDKKPMMTKQKVLELIAKHGLENACTFIKRELIRQKNFPPEIEVDEIQTVLSEL